MARVVEPVLAARRAVQVDDQLEAVISSPGDRVSEIRELSLYVRFSRADLPRPISYRKPYVVQPVSRVRRSAPRYRRRREGDPAHPAAAIAAKSASVIQVFQWFVSVCCAVFLFCNAPNVHSSTMFAFPVLSNRLGVIQGCAKYAHVSWHL